MIFIIVMIIEDLIKKILKEATGDSTGSRGSYAPPLQPGIRDFDKSKLAPFTDSLTNYKSPLVAYDSYDHDWDLRSDQIRALEKTARKISNFIKKHPDATNSDEDGNVLNRTPSGKENSKKLEIVPVKHKKNKSKINEITTTTTAGEYSGPQELGLRKWKKSELGAFDIESDSPANNVFKKRTTKKNVYKIVGGWEPQQGKFEVPTYDVDGEHESQLSKGQLTNDPIEWYRPLKRKSVTKKDILKRQKMNEDLAVWFGEKKKPKGSSQPKGPWVDICRKVDGKHPPCGRSDASEGSYPKCRAAGVAGKMSDSEKRNACSQKRNAEKNDPQSGKGQKPVMVSHKKKTNENMKRRIITLTEDDLTRIVKRVLNEEIDFNDTNKQDMKKLNNGGIELKCVKINKNNPEDSQASVSGPYPWSGVEYDKLSRPVKLRLYKTGARDVEYGTKDSQIMTLSLEEVTDPVLKQLTNKKYILITYNSPGVTGKQYCRVEGEMDQEWKDNFFNFGNNSNIIDPFPKLD